MENKWRVPGSLSELVDPKHTALLIIDVQKDYFEKGGVYDKHGRSFIRGRDILGKIRTLAREARASGVPVFYSIEAHLPGHMSDGPPMTYRLMKAYNTKDPPESAIEGSWGQEIVDDIKPVEGDIIVKKTRTSAFFGTNLDGLLKMRGIETILAAGVVTEGCVYLTAWHAVMLDYMAVVLKDCCDTWTRVYASTSEAEPETPEEREAETLRRMQRIMEVVTSDEIIKIWKSARRV